MAQNREVAGTSSSGSSTVPKPGRPLSDAQRLAWLRLIRSENVGPVTFRELINHYGGAIEALAALPELSRRGGRGQPIRICREADALTEIERSTAAGAQLVAIGEAGYPPWLAQTDAPPPLLHVKGRLALALPPIISIVGSRNGSAAGQKIARTLAIELGKAGFVIASGLARGIDGTVHRASLERGTIAVVAGGVDVIYPPEHADLQRDIGERGLLITERPPGFEPRAVDFPRRNRIISGIAAGIIVVEAARRSGSLITARFAAEQGRDVFAVPGNPLDPRAEGTNGLLKSGATLVTHAADVIEALRPVVGAGPKPPFNFTDAAQDDSDEPGPVELPAQDARSRVLQALGPAPVELDDIARACQLPIKDVRIVLIELDLAGRIERHPGNLVSLQPLP